MKKTINIAGKIVSLENPLIMGIMNITPDSFHKDSRYSPFEEDFLKKADEMIINGADILDIGGYSTRPHAEEVSVNEELERVIPTIKILKKYRPNVIISIDTFRAKVATEALKNGANIINDISGGALDHLMFETVIKSNVPYILTHSRGNPKNMNEKATYDDLIFDILSETFEKANYLKRKGVKDIIIDPGFGFAKTLNQNYELFKNIEVFKKFDFPILIGVSRKSMVYKYLDITAEESLNATGQLNLLSLLKKVNILRVHDIKATKQTLLLHKKLY